MLFKFSFFENNNVGKVMSSTLKEEFHEVIFLSVLQYSLSIKIHQGNIIMWGSSPCSGRNGFRVGISAGVLYKP